MFVLCILLLIISGDKDGKKNWLQCIRDAGKTVKEDSRRVQFKILFNFIYVVSVIIKIVSKQNQEPNPRRRSMLFNWENP